MPTTDAVLTALLHEVADTGAALATGRNEQARRIEARLRDSVARPLRQVAETVAGGEEHEGDVMAPVAGLPASLADRLWQLARAATVLRVQRPEVAELAEAAAALQDLAIGLAQDGSAAAQIGELAEMQAGLRADIRAMTNGPYLVTNARVLLDWLGQPLPVRPQLALCRCGRSWRCAAAAARRSSPCVMAATQPSGSPTARIQRGSPTDGTPTRDSR
jgi:hypothetical protein